MKVVGMENENKLNEDLIWLCFVNYVKTYERAFDAIQADERSIRKNKPKSKP